MPTTESSVPSKTADVRMGGKYPTGPSASTRVRRLTNGQMARWCSNGFWIEVVS